MSDPDKPSAGWIQAREESDLTLPLDDEVHIFFRRIKAGTFRMGSRGCNEYEEPIYTVEISECRRRNTSRGRVAREPVGSFRHAWKCVGMVCGYVGLGGLSVSRASGEGSGCHTVVDPAAAGDTTGYDLTIKFAPRQGVPVIDRAIMSSTYTSLHYHLVFSTKDRVPLIAPAWRERLHEYLGSAVRGLDGVPGIVGGVADHVHFLVSLRPTHCLADFMRELKKASSRWVKETINLARFQWQEGYGAFTVSPSQRRLVRDYIANQEEHHAKRTFQDELVVLLNKSGVEFDPRYLD